MDLQSSLSRGQIASTVRCQVLMHGRILLSNYRLEFSREAKIAGGTNADDCMMASSLPSVNPQRCPERFFGVILDKSAISQIAAALQFKSKRLSPLHECSKMT